MSYQTGINPKVNKLDTASTLEPYLRDADTTAMLASYLRKTTLPTTGLSAGNLLHWDGSKWVSLPIGTPGQILSVSSTGELTWVCMVTNSAGTPSSNPTIAVNDALTPITIATTGATGIGTVSGLPTGVTASWSSNVITISGTPTVTGTFDYIIRLTGGCGSIDASGRITVNLTTIPGSPTGIVATAGQGSASVAFTVPTNSGGTSITSYTVTANPGGISATGATSPIIVTGLTNGTTYTFTVTATNSVGSSVSSSASTPVTPATTVPGAPTSVVATAGNTTVSVAFTPPTSNGGSSITSYTVTSSPVGGTVTGVSSPLMVTGLTNGTSYTFTVVATNAVGNSSASSPSNAVTPVTVPSAPTSVTAVRGNAQATVSFTLSSSTGGSAITGYTVTSSPAGGTGTGSSSPIIVTGLTNGTAYTFTVVATNSAGNSLASSASNSVSPFVSACGSTTSVTDRDGNSYNTVSIGTQCWLSSNLRVSTYNNGDSIPLDASGGTTGNGVGQTWSGRTNGARTVYAHDNNNLTSYGYLYNWYAASDSRRICPTGWHVSTDSEWTNLTTYLGGESVAGDKLKELGTIYWSSTTGSGTNESGFSARGGGARSGSSNDGLFDNLRFLGVFWTATEANSTLSWRRILQANQVNALRTGTEKYRGFSIRCLKD